MRSPADADIIQIDVTSKCHESCSACTRHIGLIPADKHWEMDPDTFRRAVRSMAGWHKPGNVLGVIAGEPTLSKHFNEYCRILREEWNPGHDVSFPAPIHDMNRFAHERLFDRSNGRGLWTAFGPKFMDAAEEIYQTFSHWNSNDHSGGGHHQANLIDRKTLCDALGISDEEWIRYRDACWVQNTWSPAITPWGAYFCEHAAQLDILFNEGKRGWPIEPGWWKRTPAEFGEQLEICEMCSLALPGPSLVDSDEKDIVSAPNRIRLEQVGSPGAKRGRLIDYDPAVHTEKRVVTTKDSYVAPSGIRVGPDNKFVYGKRTALVVTCVGRAEDLARTLPRNAKLVDQVVVVTGGADHDTQKAVLAVAELHPHVVLVVADPHAGDSAFNKGALLNAGLAALRSPDWVLLSDADVYLHPQFGGWLAAHALNPGVLHGTPRYDVKPAGRSALLDALDGKPVPVPVGPAGGVNAEPNGYFQLFNRRASAIRDRWPKVFPETFCSAGGVDSWLFQQFDAAKRVMIDVPAFHVEHGPFGSGWNGPTAAGPRWRQCGIMTANGYSPVGGSLTYPARLKFTDTRLGESFEAECREPPMTHDPDQLRRVELPGGGFDLVFLGRPLDHAHVHVAVWG